MKLKINEKSQCAFIQEGETGKAKILFGVKPIPARELKEGEMTSLHPVEAEFAETTARCIVELERKDIVNLGTMFLQAATKDELLQILKKSRYVTYGKKRNQYRK